MRPEEAKKIYCPFFIMSTRNMDKTCMADNCMMWRWNYTPEFGTHSHNEYPNGNWQTDGDGYCGLGGKE